MVAPDAIPRRRWYTRPVVFVLLAVTLFGAVWSGRLLIDGYRMRQYLDARRPWIFSVTREPISPPWLAKIAGDRLTPYLQPVTAIWALGASFGDEDLRMIGQLHDLKRLFVSSPMVSKVDLRNPPQRYPQVTDRGIAYLVNLQSLEELGLDHTQVTEASLVHLQKLKALKSLSIGVDIWDLNAQRNPLSTQKLRDALPGVEVQFICHGGGDPIALPGK